MTGVSGSRAVRTDDGDDVAPADAERDAAEDPAAPDLDSDIPGLDDHFRHPATLCRVTAAGPA
ncbi:hypothetical protein ACQP1W_43415 [Spirillospora sp. CA-255316]